MVTFELYRTFVSQLTRAILAGRRRRNPNWESTRNHTSRVPAPELNLVERRNWMIHIHYVRKEFDTCKALLKEQLQETNEMCEYACYIQVSDSGLQPRCSETGSRRVTLR